MQYDELAPGQAGGRVAQSYWRFRLGADAGGPITHVIVPDAMTSLSVAVTPRGVGPLLVAGPTRRAHVSEVQPGTMYAGVRLRPECAGPVLGVGGSALRGLFQPVMPPLTAPEGIADLIADFARTGEWQALNSRVAELAADLERDAAVAEVAARLVAGGGRGQIRDLAAQVGISERQLRRRFFEAAGMTPKEFAGVRRLREACILAVDAQQSWAAAAAATDYADQSHLSREVREAFAQTPRRIASYLRQIDHRFAT